MGTFNITSRITEKGLTRIITTLSNIKSKELNIQMNGTIMTVHMAKTLGNFLLATGKKINLTITGLVSSETYIIPVIIGDKCKVHEVGVTSYDMERETMEALVEAYSIRGLYVNDPLSRNHYESYDNPFIKEYNGLSFKQTEEKLRYTTPATDGIFGGFFKRLLSK